MQFGTKTCLSLLIAFLFTWVGLRLILPLTAPFLFGAALALAAEPMTGLLRRKLHLPRALCAGIGVSAAFFFFSMALLLLCAFLVRELRSLSGILPQLEQTMRSGLSLLRAWLLNISFRMPESLRPLLQENIDTLFANGAGFLEQSVRWFLGLTGNILSHIPDSALTLGTTILSGYMISAKLPQIRRWILRRFPREKIRTFLAYLKQLKQVLAGWLLAQLKLMGVAYCILFPGLLLLRIPKAYLWAAGITLVDAFPVLGTGTVLLPWALLSLLQQKTAQAIGLAGLYVTISLIRSALEPKLIARELNLDPLVTLFVMYAGFRLWGIGGMILAPLVTVTALQLLPARKKSR